MVVNNTKMKEMLGLYDFYKIPAGQDCLPKTYYYSKYGAITGSIWAVVEICCVSQPSTLFGTITRFGHFTLPLAGVGFVFGSSLCLLAHARKKDDILNHTIAGALAGSVYSFKYNRVYPGHVMGICLGFLAGYMKYFHEAGLPIMEYRKDSSQRYTSLFDFHIKMYDDPGRPTRA